MNKDFSPIITEWFIISNKKERKERKEGLVDWKEREKNKTNERGGGHKERLFVVLLYLNTLENILEISIVFGKRVC